MVRGKSATHEVVLFALATTGRLDSFEITPIGVVAKIVGRCTAIVPGEPPAWTIDLGTRTIVKSLGELRSTPGIIEAGTTILDPPLQSMDHRAWSLLGELKSRIGPASGGRGDDPVHARRLRRDDRRRHGGRASAHEVSLDLEAAAPTPLEAGAGLTPPASLLSLGVACLSPGGFDAGALAKIGDAWREEHRGVLARLLPKTTPEPVMLTWTGTSDELIGRLAG